MRDSPPSLLSAASPGACSSNAGVKLPGSHCARGSRCETTGSHPARGSRCETTASYRARGSRCKAHVSLRCYFRAHIPDRSRSSFSQSFSLSSSEAWQLRRPVLSGLLYGLFKSRRGIPHVPSGVFFISGFGYAVRDGVAFQVKNCLKRPS